MRINGVRLLPALVIWIAIASCSSADDEPFLTPIEFTPYAVAIRVDLPGDDAQGVIDTAKFNTELQTAVARFAGQRWDIDQTIGANHRWARASAWRSLTKESLPIELDAVQREFVYLIRMQWQTDSLRAEVRLWEPLLKSLSPLRTVTARDPRALPELIAVAVWDLFRPRGHWQKIDDGQARLTVQAGGLGLEAGLPPLVQPGEIFAPWIVMRKRDQSVERIVPQPWTYFIAETLTEGRGTARIVSGIRNPLGLKPRGRVEFLAVAARSSWPETEFTFRRQSSPPEVLAAHEVQWHRDEFPLDEEHPPELQRQLTDRFGRVTLKRDAESRLQWLSISSGSQLLARLPVVPGEESHREVMLPDDSLRLQVEGQLQLVQSDLLSFVATRTALMAIARASAKKADWATVDSRLKHLDALPTPQSFLDRVTAIRVTAVNRARERRDRTSEQRILRMTDDTAELVKRYLTDEKIVLLKEELAELRKADRDEPEAGKPKL
ncbi:MAG TPA: hypothetical protein VFG20_11530 [Planctomycetaceae bacterium]|nr:hypothetical protein [Planctomycetaceae bacterium]